MTEFTEEEREYLEEPRIGRIATCGDDGPHVTPVWFEAGKDHITISTDRDSKKVQNLKRRGEAAVTIDGSEGGFQHHGVAVRGETEVLTDGEGEMTESIFRRYLDDPGENETAKRILGGDRVYLKVHADEIRSWGLD